MSERLLAINACLAGVGITPVDSEDAEDLDAAQASATLDRVTRELLGRGWWFNTEDNWKLAPEEGTGEIPLQADIMNILPTGASRLCKLTMRKRKIYDLDNHTYVIEDALDSEGYVNFQAIILLDYEDLPPIVKEAVTARARRIFAQDTEVDANRWNFQIRDDEKALEMVLIEESRNQKGNYFRDNPTAAGHISQIGGYNALGNYQNVFRGKRYS